MMKLSDKGIVLSLLIITPGVVIGAILGARFAKTIFPLIGVDLYTPLQFPEDIVLLLAIFLYIIACIFISVFFIVIIYSPLLMLLGYSARDMVGIIKGRYPDDWYP